MASIFFTERLPAFRIQKCKFVVSLREVRGVDRSPMPDIVGLLGGSRTPFAAFERDEPALASYSLPEKQGLCQVINGLVFETLSDF
jgi:hypothetical protein